MKFQKTLPIITAFMLSLTLSPISASAASGSSNGNNSDFCSPQMEVGSVCHCGGIRQSTIEHFADYWYCDTHKGACNYYTEYDQEYFYCTNPYCTDTWYGDRFNVKVYHKYN